MEEPKSRADSLTQSWVLFSLYMLSYVFKIPVSFYYEPPECENVNGIKYHNVWLYEIFEQKGNLDGSLKS